MAVGNQPGQGSFESILFISGDAAAPGAVELELFGDLNLDQVLAAMETGRESYGLNEYFSAPLHNVDAVRYRQEVLRDLEKPAVLQAVRAFAERMQSVRLHRVKADALRHPQQKRRWFLDASQIYCEAVADLGRELVTLDVASGGLRAFRAYLDNYIAGEHFQALAADTKAVEEALAAVRYAVSMNGPRVRVTRYEGEPDYSAEVEKTFARFKQGATRSYLARLPDWADLNHVEERILDLVARLNLPVFASLREFCERHSEFLDPVITRFEREVQFFVAYLELIEPLRKAGLPFCYPHVSVRSKETVAAEAFDLALALKLVSERRRVAGNDLVLEGPERIIVVTGPNNGGKTTFARMFGQLHYLASLGLLVPGNSGRLFLPDRVFTHFEREEDIETLRGKLDDELVRVRQILEAASGRSVVVMNESFGSTTLNDALFIGTDVMRRLLELGVLGVYVTFVDELASLSDATVSMVSTVMPDNPAIRTYKIIRRRADGRAYAWAIAEKYGLSYERLRDRVA